MTAPEWVDQLEEQLLGGRHHTDPLQLGATVMPAGTDRRGRRVGTWRTPALDLICEELVRLADGDSDRLMVFIPPQEGKSTTVSQWFPVWLLESDPTLRIAVVSYQAQKAVKWGRRVRNLLVENPKLGVRIKSDTRAADHWETEAGGGMISVGIEGGISGEPVDVLIIDDPVRGRAEAESKTYREMAWDWWESNGSTRLSSRGRVVLMTTRWHTDDLAGRILTEEPEDWRVVSIPAVAERDDQLGRAPGVELQSVQGRPPGWFHKLQKQRSSYVWQSIYQQRPTAAQGNLFKRGNWRYWEPVTDYGGVGTAISLGGTVVGLDQCWRFATVDLATSMRTSGDFTVAAAWALTLGGDLVLLDRVRDRISEADHFERIRPLIGRYRLDTLFVESRMFGTTLVYEAGAAGIPLSELKADKDKLTRALPAAGRQTQRRVWLPARAPWLDEWLDECAEFPTGAHDDQVDVLAYAVRVAVTGWSPVDALGGLTRQASEPVEPELDFMNIPL